LILALAAVSRGEGGDSRCAPLAADSYYLRTIGGKSMEERLISNQEQEVLEWFASLEARHAPQKAVPPEKSSGSSSGCSATVHCARNESPATALFLMLGSVLYLRRRLSVTKS
jgi:hypothetical protein